MKLERVHLRCTMEGIEVPCVSATIRMNRNSPSSADIQIIPSPLAKSILPRTVLHLFYLDHFQPATSIGAPGGDIMIQNSTNYERPSSLPPGEDVIPEVPADFLSYRLLFVGEVIGIQYSKAGTSRAVILTCLDMSSYWDTVLHDRRDGLFPPTRMPRFQGIARGAFWDLLGGDTGALYDKLNEPPQCFPQVSGYLGGILHLMEEVFGTYHRRIGVEGSGGRVIGSQNPFAAMAELRLRLLQQVGAPPGDSTPLRLMRSQGFGSIWRQGIRGLPKQFSFRTLMNALMQYTFYSVFPLSTPHYTPPSGSYAEMMGWTRMLGTPEEDTSNTPSLASRLAGVISAFRLSLRIAHARMDACDSYNDPAAVRAYQDTKLNVDKGVHRIWGLIPERPAWAEIRNAIRFLQTHTRKFRPIQTRGAHIDQLGQQCSAILALLQGVGGHIRRPAEEEFGQPAFLHAQLLRPDIWFCPPPRCNVLFPESYGRVTMSRNFLSEPTRLMIKSYDGLLGETGFFDNWYFAPTAVGLLHDRPILRRQGGTVATGDSGITNDLMSHELYTGIIPSFQKFSDREMTIGKHVLDAGRTEDRVENQALDYFQKVTNFLFFQSRFGNRNVTIQSVFNPFLVPGFPGLVIDGGTDARSTQFNEMLIRLGEMELDRSPDLQDAQRGEVLELIRGRTGVHYLGVIESLTHNLDAAGNGTTDVVLSYARDHRERVELFGTDVVQANRRRVYERVRRNLTYGDLGQILSWLNPETIEADEMTDPISLRPNLRQEVQGITDPVQIRERLREILDRGYTTTRGDEITSRTAVVAAFREPQIDAPGPMGGKLTSVTDVTSRYMAQAGTARPLDRRLTGEIEEVDEDIAAQERALDHMYRIRTVREPGGDSAHLRAVEEGISDAEEHLDAMKARRAQLQRQHAGPRRMARPLSLYGVYGDGRRLPQASIPPELIGGPHPASAFGPDVTSYVGDPNIQVTLYAYEITEDVSGLSGTVDLPIEDVVRPPWYPDIWLNGRIGGAVYQPLLGTTAISDPIAIFDPTLMDSTPGEEGSLADRIYTSRPEEGTEGGVVASLLDGASVEGAVDFLVHTYSTIKRHYDATEFARNYNYRLVASMFDMFGSADLEMASDGTIVKGVEGFHSRAFGPYSDLFGIAPGDTIKLLGIEEGDVAARAQLDVRGRRHALILAYQKELEDRVLPG